MGTRQASLEAVELHDTVRLQKQVSALGDAPAKLADPEVFRQAVGARPRALL